MRLLDIHLSSIPNYHGNHEGSSRKAVQDENLRPLRRHLTKIFATPTTPPQTKIKQLEAITAVYAHGNNPRRFRAIHVQGRESNFQLHSM